MQRHGSGWRPAVLLLAPLLLAACAGTGKVSRLELTPAAGSYFTITVHSGDSLSRFAEQYNVKKDDLLALNVIDDRNTLVAGETLRIPAYGYLHEPEADPPVAARHPDPVPIERAPLQDLTPSRVVSVPIPKRRPAESAPALTPATAPPSWFDAGWFSSFTAPEAKTAADSPKLLWPVQGPIISNFGPSSSGERNDGINISAPRGAPVHASAAGIVTYVGNELKGYGNLVLIRHEDGYVTAYAHSDSVTVSRGEHVARGQVIGYAGATGDVNEPQLHFELRRGTKPVDPTPYLIAAN